MSCLKNSSHYYSVLNYHWKQLENFDFTVAHNFSVQLFCEQSTKRIYWDLSEEKGHKCWSVFVLVCHVYLVQASHLA